MKILFTIASLGPGGAERVLTTLSNYWSKEHEVIIIKSGNDDSFYYLNDDVILESLNMHQENYHLVDKVLHNFKIVQAMRASIKKHNPSIVISFADRTNIYAILATLFLSTKLIISERINYTFLQNQLWRLLRRVLYPFSDGLVVLSKYDYQKYTYVKRKKIIFNPTNLNQIKLGNEFDKEKVILAVGRLVDIKGFDILLSALSNIDKKLLKGWKVYIIGEGIEKNKLIDFATELDIGDKIEFLGQKKDIVDYYKKSSIFVSSSKAEGFPNALAEAFSCGCACVATDCLTGPSEIIQDGVNGFLVKVDDIDMLQKKIEELICNDILREKYSRHAIASSKRFNIDCIAKEWEVFISEVIDAK